MSTHSACLQHLVRLRLAVTVQQHTLNPVQFSTTEMYVFARVSTVHVSHAMFFLLIEKTIQTALLNIQFFLLYKLCN